MKTSQTSVQSIAPWLLAVAAITAALVAFVLLRPTTTHAAPASGGTTVSTAKTKLGRILVNSSGRSLYLFEKDKSGKSACSGQCAKFWPPLITKGKPRATAGVKASLLGTTKRADGRMQVTYNHHPLYTFKEDTAKGMTKGEGTDFFGGEWYVLSPAGSKIEKSSSSSSSSSGGGSYGP
jgi:predicted lipoprotein with Yx(FWY)xxD motif